MSFPHTQLFSEAVIIYDFEWTCTLSFLFTCVRVCAHLLLLVWRTVSGWRTASEGTPTGSRPLVSPLTRAGSFRENFFFFPSIFFWPFFGFIDRTAEDMTGNRMREREGEWGRGTQLAFYDDCQQKLICVLSVRLFAVCINYKLTSCCIEEDLKLNNWDHKLTRKLFTEVTDQARSRITFPLLAIRKNAGVRLFWIGFIFFFFCFSDCKQSVLCTRR